MIEGCYSNRLEAMKMWLASKISDKNGMTDVDEGTLNFRDPNSTQIFYFQLEWNHLLKSAIYANEDDVIVKYDLNWFV